MPRLSYLAGVGRGFVRSTRSAARSPFSLSDGVVDDAKEGEQP